MKAMSNDYIYRTPSIYDSQAPGNGLVACLLIFYPLVFVFFSTAFGLEKTGLYNVRIWGSGNEKNFTVFYAFLSLLPVKYAIFFLFYQHLIDVSYSFRKLLARSAMFDCGLFAISLIFLFLAVQSIFTKLAIILLGLPIFFYFIQVKRFFNGQKPMNLRCAIISNTFVALCILMVIFPAF
jgi:hypothetical protein